MSMELDLVHITLQMQACRSGARRAHGEFRPCPIGQLTTEIPKAHRILMRETVHVECLFSQRTPCSSRQLRDTT